MMQAKTPLTREQLEEDFKIVSVYDTEITKSYIPENRPGVIKEQTLRPTLNIQRSRKTGRVKYVSWIVSLYDFTHKRYRSIPVHKLIYAWHLGECQAGKVIDHIDCNPLNNNILNLREVSEEENRANRRKYQYPDAEELRLQLQISDRAVVDYMKETIKIQESCRRMGLID